MTSGLAGHYIAGTMPPSISPSNSQNQNQIQTLPNLLSSGSLTTTESSHSQNPQPVLRLRGIRHVQSQHESPPRRNIRWAADVVDNEGLGRKSSKVCCIYHPTRAVGESSSDESSSSDSSSGSDSDSDSVSSDSASDDLKLARRGRGGARMAKAAKSARNRDADADVDGKGKGKGDGDGGNCDHPHHEHGHYHDDATVGEEVDQQGQVNPARQRRTRRPRRPSPNAYERQPNHKPRSSLKKKGGGSGTVTQVL